MRRPGVEDDHDALDTVTHYEVLGVPASAPTSEVRRAYVALARQHHPDRDGGDAEAMRAINDAWATLRDPGRRARYDRSLRAATVPGAPATAASSGAPDLEGLLDDLEDDTPFGGHVVLPPWVSLVPVATFVASLAALLVGLVFGSAPALGGAAALFLSSCLMFLVAPFVALLASRRRG